MTMVACDPVDHAARRLDGYQAILPEARALLEALRPIDSTFQIPQYVLVIAKKEDGDPRRRQLYFSRDRFRPTLGTS
jgi:hypothetical protein